MLLAHQLPNIFVTNHRSYFPKFHNFLDLMLTQNLTLGLHSEIWEDKEKRDHQNKIEEALELEGIQYISNTRLERRGGGAAISLISGDFTLTRLEVIAPKNLEVVWGIVRPKTPTSQFKGIIVCSFYSVPYSKRKSQLIEHITINYETLKAGNKDCFFLLGGDKNDLDIRHLLDISPNFHQHNTKPTHNLKNIDVMVSDMVHLYGDSEIYPSVPTDIPDGQTGGGKPSDHSVVVSRPRLERLSKPARELVTKKTRRMDDEKKMRIGQWVQQESWEDVYNGNTASGMAVQFTKVVFEQLDKICPEEEIQISKMEGKETSLALQSIARQKLREYTRHGNSVKFKELKRKQKSRIRLEGQKKLEKAIEKAGKRGSGWMKKAKVLSARPGEDISGTFSLPSHIDNNFSAIQSAEAFVKYFSKISQEFTPLEQDILPLRVESRIASDPCIHPEMTDHEIYQNMRISKKTDSVLEISQPPS